MTFNGSSWIKVGDTVVSTGDASYTSLAFSPAGEPYVAFSDATLSDRISVRKFDGNAWSPAGTEGFSEGEANYIDLAFSPAGSPYVVFQDVSRNKKATVMKFEGNAWSAVGSPGFSADLPQSANNVRGGGH